MSSSSCFSTSAFEGIGIFGVGASVRENTGVGLFRRSEFFLPILEPEGAFRFVGLPSEGEDGSGVVVVVVNREGLSFFFS